MAAAVRAARAALGVSQQEFAERGGLHLKTIQRIEAGAITPRGRTLLGVDTAAGWAPGRARAILDGNEVTEARSADPSNAGEHPEQLTPRWWLALRRQLTPEMYADVSELIHRGQAAAESVDLMNRA